MINQLQLLIMLPILTNYFPSQLIQFILEMDFALLSFDFIPISDILFLNIIADELYVPQSDEFLNEIGLESNSSLVNYLSLTFVA